METQLQTIQMEDLQVIPTKTQVLAAADRILSIVDDGMIDPLQALASITAYSMVFEEARKKVLPLALAEAEKYTEKTIDRYGVQFQKKETGVKYDFSEDPEWVELNEQMKAKQALLKGRETTLKTAGLCARSASDTLAVTLAK